MSPRTDSTGHSGVRLGLWFPPVSPLFVLCRPVVEVDDEAPRRARWGTKFIPLAPGQHHLRCYFRFIGNPYAGDSSLEVEVPADGVVRVRWLAPPYPLAPGRWKVALAG